jgi:hypothetical protein
MRVRGHVVVVYWSEWRVHRLRRGILVQLPERHAPCLTLLHRAILYGNVRRAVELLGAAAGELGPRGEGVSRW